MKFKITLLFLITTLVTFAQFPGDKTKESQTGPDKFVYKINDVVRLGKALNGKTFRNVFAYKYKNILDNIDDALDLNVQPSYKVFEDKDNNMIIKGDFIIPLPNDYNNFKGKIKYFKRVKSENNYFTFAIIKVLNSKLRIAIPLQSAILTGEMISNKESFAVKDIEENKELDQFKLKSFSNEFDLKLLSCKGDKNRQQVVIEFLIKHKKVHQEVCFENYKNSAKAYDLEGNEYNSNIISIGSEVTGTGYLVCNEVPTNVPLKASINFIKILPTVEKLSFVTIKVSFRDFDGTYRHEYGNIELQNLDIDWEN